MFEDCECGVAENFTDLIPGKFRWLLLAGYLELNELDASHAAHSRIHVEILK
jgi:hypothetical protein